MKNETKLTVAYPVIVEGKYDKLRLESVISGTILTTEGFGIFKKTEKQAFFRALAKKTPLIVLTDSDGAGKVIRGYLSSVIPPDRLIPLYVPRIHGAEKRKTTPSAEGVLGVEGMERDLLRRLFFPFAEGKEPIQRAEITKTDFYLDGLTGGTESRSRRDAFAESLGLPPGMTPGALLAAVRIICTKEEYKAAVDKLKAEFTPAKKEQP